jgi:hypothetical protein
MSTANLTRHKDRVSTEHSGTASKTFEQWLDELTGPAREMMDRELELRGVMPNSRAPGS